MSALQPSDFVDFFLACHDKGDRPGFGPFPWQRRLAEQVAVGHWPDVLDLPTASGKTTCIDIAVFALACQANFALKDRTAARRILFVVDRRIIVDAAYQRAREIARRLRKGEDAQDRPSEILKRVAQALRQVAGTDPNHSDENPLACFQLRGGVYRDQSWARSPTQPTVIASTVDQIGSRLLFRGYGVSDSLRPIHAGLAGNDALILLDEAHCARPFLQTASAVRDYRRQVRPGFPLPPFHVAVLSATPPDDPDNITTDEKDDDKIKFHTLTEEDFQPEHLGRRLDASKAAELIEPVNAPFKPGDNRDKLAEALAEHAQRLAGSDTPQTVVIFANRVDTARKVHKELRNKLRIEVRGKKARPDEGSSSAGADVLLMIGRMRPIDRDDLVGTWGGKLKSGADRSALDRTVYVVATQCLEVGADFDFDVLVTECASLDALRQRFGRLNRLGRPIDARAAILIRSDQSKEGAKDDPIYGSSLNRTWQWLTERSKTEDGRSVIDFGINPLAPLLKADPDSLKSLAAPATDAPVMLPAHVDCWVQTQPRPMPDPDPALFLHGPGFGRPDVQVCWRADLNADLKSDPAEDQWINAVSLFPPTTVECMPIPLHLALTWLTSHQRPADEDGDLEQAPISVPDPKRSPESKPRWALLWAGPDNKRTGLVGPNDELRPGDTLVIPAVYGGWEELGHVPGREERPEEAADQARWAASIDVAERAARIAGRRVSLRLHPSLMDAWPSEARDKLIPFVVVDEEDDANINEAKLGEALSLLAETELAPDWLWLRRIAKQLAGEFEKKSRPKIEIYSDLSNETNSGRTREENSKERVRALIVLGRGRPESNGEISEAHETSTSEDDTASSGTCPVVLDEHCRGVAGQAAMFAETLDLAEPTREALRVAGLWHDLGKSDRRFQTYLHGGNVQMARLAPDLLAKSDRQPREKGKRERARRLSRWPKGGRHEMLSVRIAETLIDRLGPAVDRDLVLHLIASHHGHARPFAPDTRPESVDRSARSVSGRDQDSVLKLDLEPAEFPDQGRHHQQLAQLALQPLNNGQAFRLPDFPPEGPKLHQLDSGVGERFWILVRRYGWWGLAWLESLLRLADHRVSEDEQDRDSEEKPT